MAELRLLVTRLFFLVMGLRVSHYRKEAERLWALSEEARLQKLDQVLARNRPLNAVGEAVTGLDALGSSPSLSKKQFLTQTRNSQGKSDTSRFDRHTAGTTGQPTRIRLNREELGRMLGVRDYCFRHYGVKLGQREARLWGRPEYGIKSRLKNFLMNRRVFYPVGPKARDQVEELLKWHPDYLYGYGSLLLEAARLLDGMDLEFEPPKCVVCTAETILPAQKAYISRAFQAPVVEEYGSTEFDVIAFECAAGHRHLVNPWLIIESSEDQGCLATDVSRTSQSLVRYELGDHVILKSYGCGKLGDTRVIDQLEGRSLNRFAYLSKSQKFHALEFARAVNRYQSISDEVFEFTVYQHQYGRFELETSISPKKGRQDLSNFISDSLQSSVGVQIDIKPVNEDRHKEPSEKKGYFVQAMEAAHDE